MADGLVPVGSHPAPTPRASGGALGGEPYAPPASPRNAFERPLAAARRFKWLIAAIVVVSTTLGVIGTRFLTPQYYVKATVWIEQGRSSDRTGPIQGAQLLASSAWIQLFRSYKIVDQVVRSLVLYVEPANAADKRLFESFTVGDRFVPGVYEIEINRVRKTWMLRNGAGVAIDRGAATDSVGGRIGFRWLLPAAIFDGNGDKSVAFKVVTPREKSAELLKQVENRLEMGSNFLQLTYHAPDPQLASKTMNTWLTEFVSVAADLKKRNVTEFANILREQLKYAEKATQDAESAYQNFRVHTITLPTEGGPVAAGIEATRDPALNFFFEQKILLDNLTHDREALQKTLASARSGNMPYGGLMLIPSVATSPGAAALREALTSYDRTQASLKSERQNFTDEYPSVKQLKAAVDQFQNQTIPQLADQFLVQVKEREADYERRIAGSSRELQQIPPRTIEETRLKRQVAVAEGLYTNLKSRYAEAQLSEASATPDISVLDTAIAPLAPSSNTAPMIVLIALAGGLGAAIALAILLDTIDGRLRYSEQVAELGLPIAGAVPRVPKGGINSGSPEQALQFVEAFRTLRMHVTHSVPGEKIVLAVSSAAPGDGKSLVSANLALSFAEAGVRTVLVDGDTRRGSLHKMFGLSAAGGLTDFLSGAISKTEVVRATSHAHLSFVSCGRRHPRSPELLTSMQLKHFVQHLSQAYDVVIFDTPPLAAGIDGFAISAAAGSILMVLRLGQTERRLVSAKLNVLARLPVDMLGAVLNGVPLTGEFQYYAYTAGYAIDGGDGPEELEAITAK